MTATPHLRMTATLWAHTRPDIVHDGEQRIHMGNSRARGLQANALGITDTVVMAVAGSAPAYTLTATTAVLIGAVGLASPAALLYCGIPMLGIALAFCHLNRIDVNAGASYSWVGRTLHPFLGFVSGWALAVSATIFMVAGSLPAGSMTLSLFDAGLADDTSLATAVGAAWFLVMLLVVLGGARLTVRAQLFLSGIELAVLALCAVGALLHSPDARPFDWSWLGFSHFSGVSGFSSGALIAAFYYWGWDVTSNLSEETRDSRRTTGLAGLIGVGVVFLLFEVFTIAVNIVLGPHQIQQGGANVLAVLGEEIWPGWGGKLLIVSVMLSTVATLETTLIQVTRSLFAMGRDRTMPSALGRVHPRWNTPWVAIVVVGAVALLMFVASVSLGSIGGSSPTPYPRSVSRSPSITGSPAWRSSSPIAGCCSSPWPTSSSSECGRSSVPCSCSGSSSSRSASSTAPASPSVSAGSPSAWSRCSGTGCRVSTTTGP